MEALSGVASGMAVASLAIQLVGSIVKIRSFIRDVKGASKELTRLTNLLDQLKSLLEDVSHLMERQASLQQQYMPAPPAKIVASLESCKASISELTDLVEKYRRPQQSSNPSITKLKDDLRFGFRSKDVTAMEERIQRDYQCLYMALKLNDTNILLAILPRVLQAQEQGSRVSSQIHDEATSAGLTTCNEPCTSQVDFSNKNHAVIKRHRKVYSKLTKSNISQMRMIWTTATQETKIQEENQADEFWVQTSKTRDVSFLWLMIGYGLHWQSRYPCGGILPLIRIFPVVKNVWDYDEVFRYSSARDIQEMFHSGELHPFTQDIYGTSLVQIAASEQRADICRLLASYGVQYQADLHAIAPLLYATFEGIEMSTDVIRTLLFEFEHTHYVSWVAFGLTSLEPPVMMWLWHSADMIYHGEDLDHFRKDLLKRCVSNSHYYLQPLCPTEEQHFGNFMAKALRSFYDGGNAGLLEELVFGCHDILPMDSHLAGSWFLHQLSNAGLSVELCMAAELDEFLEISDDEFERDRIPIFEGCQDQGWRLHWEWVFDPLEPGLLLLSEFATLAAGPDLYWERPHFWPFSDNLEHVHYWSDQKEKIWSRANRRWEIKAQKARKRERKLLPRQQMPGTWKW